MALISCPHCGKEVSSYAEKCPKCNTRIENSESIPPKKKTNNKLIYILAICAILLIPLTMALFDKKSNSKYENTTSDRTSNFMNHKYTYVDIESGINAMIDLYSSNSFTQVTIAAYSNFTQSGRGSWEYKDGKIIFYNESGITVKGEATVSSINNKIQISLPNGICYIQDDEKYYVKNQISTPGCK